MAERPRFVLDASVATKWLLRLQDEPYLDKTDAVLLDFQQSRIDLLAPDHIRYEVGNDLRTAVVNRRITVAQGTAELKRFYALEIPILSIGPDLLMLSWALAHRFERSFYDAAYLALAEVTGYPVIHADGRLRKALGGRFPLELWIEQYQPAIR